MMNAITPFTLSQPALPGGKTVAQPSQPAPEAPQDGISLSDYKPSLLDHAKVAATPLVWAGGAAYAGTFNAVASVAGGAVGLTVGTAVGIGLGALVDKLTGNKKHSATVQGGSAGGGLGAIAGYLASSHLPPTVVTVALGIAGLGVGIAAAVAFKSSLAKKVAKKVDAEARTGNVHLSRLFRGIYDRDGKGDPAIERQVKACEQLEGAGWHFGTTSDSLTDQVTKKHEVSIHVKTPDGADLDLPMSALPYLSYLNGTGSAGDTSDGALADAVKDLATRGRALHTKNWDEAKPSTTPQEETVRLAAACDALAQGKGASCIHDGVAVQVDAKDASTLNAAMKTADDVFAQYDAHLAPAFASGLLNGDSKTLVLQALLNSPLGSDLSKGAPLFIRLVEARSSEAPYDRTWSAIQTFRDMTAVAHDRLGFEQTIDDACDLARRMPTNLVTDTLKNLVDVLSTVAPERVTEYHDGFLQLLRCTGDNVPLTTRALQILSGMDDNAATRDQISALDQLARAGAAQKDYKDLTLDYTTLMATRSGDETLAASASRYARLLGGMAARGHAQEAAPTYAFLRAAMRDGRANVQDEDALVTQVLGSLQAGTDPDTARRSVLVPGSDGTTQDVAALEQRLQGPLGSRAHTTAAVLATLPSQDVEAQVKVMETLAAAVSTQRGYGDVLMDYTTLMAVRDHSDSLEKSVEQYTMLLSGLATANKAQEAAPTYAFMQGGLSRGRFGAATFDGLCEKFLTSFVANGDARHARQVLLEQAPPKVDDTVKKDDGVIIIGGIPIPVRR